MARSWNMIEAVLMIGVSISRMLPGIVNLRGMKKYFSQLESLAQQFGADKVYGDYVKVYQRTRSQIDERVLDDIHILSETYGTDALRVEKLFSILYMAMISEENKANTRLGKRIKRLGVHKLLIENQPVYEAANFMRGMDWRTIDRLCAERNF